ncbi:long-chain-fatty-acid--CoA ligase 4-like [Tropilaelaps mercedesae]|uniref:long-chain-fatty-acid--CoA ligase n=1 Tax=Tropilaelaps mercedesae TaxID=418985 RepID=A0A1V9XZP5_9ACAR|nr:long-chain-fatty-acid--CoA ligase 4-like [Tropilaelaps mercedesae]
MSSLEKKRQSPLAVVGANVAIGIVKALMYTYDLVTLPIYALVQKPWIVWKNRSTVFAALDASSSLICKGIQEGVCPEEPSCDTATSSTGAWSGSREAAATSLATSITQQQDSESIILQSSRSGPWVRKVDRINEEVFEGMQTVDQLTRKAVRQYSNEVIFGWREIFGEEEEEQPDGKTFRKQANIDNRDYALQLIQGEYQWMSYRDFDDKVDLIGRALMSLGVRPRQNVCILAETRMEWMLAAQACLRINIPVVTLYATLGEDGIIHGITETETTHLITSQELMLKVGKLLPQLPSITHVIYMESSVHKLRPELTTKLGVHLVPFSQLEELGKAADEGLKGEIPGPDDTAIIMYTSGSTGMPKGVMISQYNIVATARGFQTMVPEVNPRDAYIAYLPLAHIFELCCEMVSIALGVRIGYASPLTLTDKSTGVKTGSKGDATLLRPTVMVSVPLILDRIRKSVTEAAEAKGLFSKMFFKHVVNYKAFWQRWGFRTPLLDIAVFNKMKALLGGRIKVIATGSAPLSADTHAFIKACLSCDLIQGYGLTETSAGATVMELSDMSLGRVGSPLSGCFLRLVDWPEAGYFATDKPNPRGEILIGGATVTKGYYKNEALTRECFKVGPDNVRWFYTGDVGEVYPDGTIKIIDRKKDLVKLQFGEYISLGKVEAELKTCPLVENVCVYGSSFHTYLVALVAPNEKNLEHLATGLNKHGLTFKELCEEPEVKKAATNEILEHARRCNLHKMEIPTKIKLCSESWLPDSGLVTAAFKIRRKQITTYYQKDIDEMYTNSKST